MKREGPNKGFGQASYSPGAIPGVVGRTPFDCWEAAATPDHAWQFFGFPPPSVQAGDECPGETTDERYHG
jgi:hypothetical protein